MNKRLVRVPLAGNAYRIASNPDSRDAEYRAGGRISPAGISGWDSPDAVFAIYIKFNSAVTFDAAIKTKVQEQNAVISLTLGSTTHEAELSEGYKEAMFGTFTMEKAGYARFELRGVSKEGKFFASPSELLLYGITEDDIASYVPVTEKDNFYWTRRGPSVHCGYDIQNRGNVEWFYNEVTVPEGNDHIGLYAMAIGFTGGYFGIQVNTPTDRRILFSVWSPYATDNPEEVPEEDRILCLGRHKKTHVGEFGGEGSGGQSYMKYIWRAGETYRFLMHIRPAENNRTEYTAYFFFPETGRFEMIASFSRPRTQTYIEWPHSFLENFHDTQGYIERTALYGNQWARTDSGEWFAPAKIRFTTDNTARRGWRKDHTGGLLPDGRFYLRHCGFFDESLEYGAVFAPDISNRVLPDIDPDSLK